MTRLLCVSLAALTLAAACTARPAPVAELKRYPLDGLEGVITRSGVTLDRQVTSDGHGSLRVDSSGPTTVRLFETGPLAIDNARLNYQARLRTQNVTGRVYLEMWCHFPGGGEFFSRGLTEPLTGTTEWSSEETPFFLRPGDRPDNIKLNVVIEGRGTVWIDDLRLTKGPLT